MALTLRPVTSRQGLEWVRQGFRAYATRPLGFLALLLAFFFLSMAISVLLPWVGSLLALMALPLLSLGFMVATQSALRGGPVHPGQLVEPVVRSSRKIRIELLKLCLLYAAALVVIAFATEALAGNPWEPLTRLYEAADQPTVEQVQDALSDPQFTQGTLLITLLVSLLSIPFWHAPALVLWGEQSAAHALFSSTIACWRTKSAFAVYGLAWTALMFLGSVGTVLMFSLMGLPQMAAVAMLPLTLVGFTVFYASLYFMFVDTFAPAGKADEPI